MRRPSTLQIGIDAQNPVELTASKLHTYLQHHGQDASPSMRIIDLRPSESFAEFHIPSSESISFSAEMPLARLATELHELLARAAVVDSEYPLMLFVSLQSPDVDDLIARELMREYEKAHGCPPPATAIGVLMGGTAGYQAEYGAGAV